MELKRLEVGVERIYLERVVDVLWVTTMYLVLSSLERDTLRRLLKELGMCLELGMHFLECVGQDGLVLTQLNPK